MTAAAFVAGLGCASVGCIGVASAADLSLKDTPVPVYAPIVWTGFYVGGHVGGAWGSTKLYDHNELNTVDPEAKLNLDSNGLLAGGQIGYNWQRGRIVYGIEADLGHMDISKDGSASLQKSTSCTGSGPDQVCALHGDYSASGGLYGDLTARLGYAQDKALFYVKGGAAFLNLDVDSHYKADNAVTHNSPFDFSGSDTLWGWTIGAGVEYALSPSWSLKAEYQHFDFGSMSLNYDSYYRFLGNGVCTPTSNGCSHLSGKTEISPTVDAVSVGVNYRFNGGRDDLK